MHDVMDTIISRQEFAAHFAEQARLTPEELDRYIVIEPCDCDDLECMGWATIPRTRWERERAEVRRKELLAQTHNIYFAELGGLIKIGISNDPERRAHSLNALLLGTCVGNRQLEKDLHSEFSDLREAGEWFRAEPRLLARIRELVEA